MSIFIGNQEINPSGLSAVYVGQNKVWPTEPPVPPATVSLEMGNWMAQYHIHYYVTDALGETTIYDLAPAHTERVRVLNPFTVRITGIGASDYLVHCLGHRLEKGETYTTDTLEITWDAAQGYGETFAIKCYKDDLTISNYRKYMTISQSIT